MRFNRLDLNLLVALDALLTERSITKAAERLNLSQSAVSSALSRLREYFNDELLVLVGRRMEPTARALSLQESVRDILVRVDSTVASPPEFDPATSDRTFRIIVSDYTLMIFTPHVLALAREARCSARFEFLPQVSNPQRNLERGEADLLIIPRGFLSPEHPHEVLYTENFLCVAWRQGLHGRGELTFDKYREAGHVVMQPAGSSGDSFENWFAKRFGLDRRIVAIGHSFTALPAMVVGNDCIATVQERLAYQLQPAFPVVLHKPPLPIPVLEQGLQWHQYKAHDPGLVWLRGLLQRAVKRMDAQMAAQQAAAVQ